MHAEYRRWTPVREDMPKPGHPASHRRGTEGARGPVMHKAWYSWPRWTVPAGGASILILLFVLNASGVLSKSVAWPAITVLTLASLFLTLAAGEGEEEDRRGDLPVVMVPLYLLLYVVHLGLSMPVLALLSWPAFILLVGLVLMRDYWLGWLFIGLGFLIVFNLAVFFAYYRPG